MAVSGLPGYGTLADQEASLPAAVEWIRGMCAGPAHIIGHSIGGAIAMLLASRHPECVASVINVEGNFTLKDAFWSARVAEMSDEEIAAVCGDPEEWLRRARVPATPRNLEIARRSLATQSRTSPRNLPI
jgi:pimeloyl-ACP methyl ester carboxylesterase